MHDCKLWRRAAVCAALVLLTLTPWGQHSSSSSSSSFIRVASGQGLSVSADNLGAGAEATANEFEQFESALELATTGGRGRGARGGTNNLGGFANAKSFATVQTAMYYIAGSPEVYDSSNPKDTPGRINYVGPPNDQKLCSTCVSQAITKAVQISVARALQQDLSQFPISPQAFYYCATPEGRSCRTGWDIPDALQALTSNLQWMLPSSCFNTRNLLKGQDEADVSDWPGICSAAATTLQCAAAFQKQRLFSCSYKSLSSFAQVQQAIRSQGAVVTRMVVSNDFDVQFNSSAKTQPGLSLPPYRYNVTSRPSFAHAALITGYDNEKFTWTILNSWGKGTAAGQLRSSGVTSDGLFKMQMGLSGVGTPDATYAVSCYPAESTIINPNADQPWTRSRRLQLTPRRGDRASCYSYTIRRGDTLAAIVDHFVLDMRQVVQDPANLGVLGALVTFKYAFGTTLKADDVCVALSTANAVTSSYTTGEANMQCSYYDAAGALSRVTCTAANFTACAEPGVVACAMNYKDINITATLPVGKPIRVCNNDWKSFENFDRVATISGSRMARATSGEGPAYGLLQLLRQVDASVTSDWVLQRLRSVKPFETLIPTKETTPGGIQVKLGVKCAEWIAPLPCNITMLHLEVLDVPDSIPEALRIVPALDAGMVAALRSLVDLQWLQIYVGGGTLLPDLASFPKLETLVVNHYCLRGSLPPRLLAGLPSLRSVTVTPVARAVGASDPAGGMCGISGTLPQSFNFAQASVDGSNTVIDLSNNRLAGQLPAGLLTMANVLFLQNNMFSGSLPAGAAGTADMPRATVLDLSGNLLEGRVPRTWQQTAADTLRYLHLDNNQALEGCIPLPDAFEVTYASTKVTGMCDGNADSLVVKQRAALRVLPKLLLGAGKDKAAINAAIQRLVNRTSDLGRLVGNGETQATVWQSLEVTDVRLEVVVAIVAGAECVTAIRFNQQLGDLYVGLNMSHLAAVVRGLPYLSEFKCIGCRGNTWPADMQLPRNLPSAAARLQTLILSGCGVTGQLPNSWGKWTSLFTLDLSFNKFTGTLPASFAGLPNIQSLLLEFNQLWGTLPSAWGAAAVMPRNLTLTLAGNERLAGTVPPAWRHFSSGSIEVSFTGVRGCLPDGVRVYQEKPLPLCSAVSSEAAALIALKGLFSRACVLDLGGLTTWIAGTNYCNGTWVGISCNSLNNVVGIDLKAASVRVDASTAVALLDVVTSIQNLTHLQSLSLSGLGLSGPLESTQPPLEPGLTYFEDLKHLDISSNPRLTGQLPNSWYTLGALQTLDLSHTGVSGTLPSAYAALQQLREFKAVNCSGIAGTLPPTWGLLKLQVLEITESGITGGLPLEWVDAAALQLAWQASVAAGATPERGYKAAAAEIAGVQPSALGLQQLRVLDLSVSRPGKGGLTGALPGSYAAMELLQVLILSGHDFSSSLPAAWTRLQQLRVLDISRNSLTGSLPSWYVSMRQLAVLKVHGNKLERAADDAPEFYEALLGPSSKLQCLSVADNAEVLVDAATATRLAAKARQRTPAVPLQINKPSSSLCDPAAYKDGGEGTLHG